MGTINIGGERLGSGAKMNVKTRSFERSTHDLGYIWRNTQAPGTLVPFMSTLMLPGDTFDIELNADVKTMPTFFYLFIMSMIIVSFFLILFYVMLKGCPLSKPIKYFSVVREDQE